MSVSDITPLASLSLDTLALRHAVVSDITPLASLSTLGRLYLDHTPVSDVTPLANLFQLQHLSLSHTPVSDITPLAGLSVLDLLDLSHTPVNDVAPLAGLSKLFSLHLDHTLVSDLTPLAGLSGLGGLYLAHTTVSDVTPLAKLNLSHLDLHGSQLQSFPHWVLGKSEFYDIRLWGNPIADVPAEFLGISPEENCLPAVRAYFANQADRLEVEAALAPVRLPEQLNEKPSLWQRLVASVRQLVRHSAK